MLIRSVRAAAVGCALGCVTGLATALSDFGAHWLWLEGLRDRAGLLLRLVGLQVPAGIWLGTLLGTGLGCADAFLDRVATRRALSDETLHRAKAARTTALFAPGVLWVGMSLFTGGKMSRLPAKAAIEAVACAALLAGTLLLAYLAQRAEVATRARPHARRWLAGGALGAAFGFGKLNQWVLPKLYDNVHGALSAAAFVAVHGGGLTCCSYRACETRTRARAAVRASTFARARRHGCSGSRSACSTRTRTCASRCCTPNAAHSRSLMQAIAPVLIEPAQRRAMEQAKQKAKLARTQRKRVRGAAGPVLDDAHILLITVDALRPDHLGAYGYKRADLARDRQARRAVRGVRARVRAGAALELLAVLDDDVRVSARDARPRPARADRDAAGGAGASRLSHRRLLQRRHLPHRRRPARALRARRVRIRAARSGHVHRRRADRSRAAGGRPHRGARRAEQLLLGALLRRPRAVPVDALRQRATWTATTARSCTSTRRSRGSCARCASACRAK